jgi:hypothetical protein
MELVTSKKLVAVVTKEPNTLMSEVRCHIGVVR